MWGMKTGFHRLSKVVAPRTRHTSRNALCSCRIQWEDEFCVTMIGSGKHSFSAMCAHKAGFKPGLRSLVHGG